MSRIKIRHTDVTPADLLARLRAFEGHYGVATADLESAFTDVEDEDLGMWLSLRSIYAHVTQEAERRALEAS